MVAVTKHPVAPTIRGAFLKALEIKGKREGKTLYQIMDEWIEQEGLTVAMNTVAKFQERTGELNLNHAGEGLVGILSALAGLGTSESRDSEVESEPAQLRH